MYSQKSPAHPVALPLPSCVILGESLPFPQLQLSHCKHTYCGFEELFFILDVNLLSKF